MRVCGVEISGSEARIVLLEGNSEDFRHLSTELKRIELNDDESAVDLRSFRDVFQALIRDHQIDHVGIKKRNKKGEFAGGAVSFKIEGIVQLLEECDIRLLSPVTISSTIKKAKAAPPDTLHKYQHNAFEVALTLLHKLAHE